MTQPTDETPVFTPVVMTPAQATAKAIADEMAYNKTKGITYGGEGPPGGYFLGEDGQPHDAHGNPIDSDADAARAAQQSEAEAAANERAIAAMQRREAGTSAEGTSADDAHAARASKKGKR